MNHESPISELHRLHHTFVRETFITTPWKTISEKLHASYLRRIEPGDADRALVESCWDLLADDDFNSQVSSFYNSGDHDQEVAARLVRNARALFATGCAAAAARQVKE